MRFYIVATIGLCLGNVGYSDDKKSKKSQKVAEDVTIDSEKQRPARNAVAANGEGIDRPLMRTVTASIPDLKTVMGIWAEGIIDYVSGDSKISTDYGSRKSSINGPVIGMLGAYKDSSNLYAVSLALIHAEIDQKRGSDKGKAELNGHSLNAALFAVPNFEILLGYDLVWSKSKLSSETGTDDIDTYTSSGPSFGFGYFNSHNEFRLIYTPKKDPSSDTPSRISPSVWEVDGLFAVDPTFKWHALLSYVKASEQNYDSGLKEENCADYYVLYTGPRFLVGSNMGVDVDLMYKPAAGSPKDNIYEANAQGYGLYPKFYKTLAPASTLMLGIDYATYARSADLETTGTSKIKVKYAKTEVSYDIAFVKRF